MPGPPPMIFLAIDPSKLTGLAWWHQDYGFHADEYGFEKAGDWIEGTAQIGGRGCRMICERYVPRADLPQDDAHYAMEMIGVARRAAIKNGCTFAEPDPGERKIATPEILRKIGIWKPGKKDANAAVQHLVAHMLQNRMLPAAWLEAVLSAGSGSVRTA